jgi:hypothetical protein
VRRGTHVQDVQAATSACPQPVAALEDLCERFAHESVALRQEPGCSSVLLDEVCVDVTDDSQCLWDLDGLDRSTGLCKDAGGCWKLAAFVRGALGEPDADAVEAGQDGDGGAAPTAAPSATLVPLEPRGNSHVARLRSRALLEVTVHVAREPASRARALRQILLLQAAAAHACMPTAAVPASACMPTPATASACAAFPFQERVCIAVGPPLGAAAPEAPTLGAPISTGVKVLIGAGPLSAHPLPAPSSHLWECAATAPAPDAAAAPCIAAPACKAGAGVCAAAWPGAAHPDRVRSCSDVAEGCLALCHDDAAPRCPHVSSDSLAAVTTQLSVDPDEMERFRMLGGP